MNKNSKRTFKEARENNGMTTNCRRDYDKGVGNSRFVSREIPFGYQKRKSAVGCGKVARKAKSENSEE